MAHQPVDVDKKELKNAQNTWQTFVRASKVLTVVTGIILLILFVIYSG